MKASDPKALIRYGLAGLALTVALAWMLVLVRDALLLVYISGLTAIGLSPLVEAASEQSARFRYRVPRWTAVLVVYLAIVGILVGVGLVILPPLGQQARALWTAFPMLIEAAREWLVGHGVLSESVSVGEALRQAPVGGSDAVGTLFGAIWTFIGGVFGALTILILSFYILLDAETLVRGFVRMFPRAERPRVEEVCRRVAAKVSAWLGGQLLLAATIGVSAAIGLWLFGVPYFYVLALIAAIGEMIPVVGPILSAIPAVAVALSVSPALGLGVALFYFLQQQFENHVLVPKIMARQVGVSPVIVITALLIGGALLGIVGALLAVPTAAIVLVLFEEWSSNGTS